MDAHHIPCTHHAARRHVFAKSSEQIGFLRSTISYFNVLFLAAEIRSLRYLWRNSRGARLDSLCFNCSKTYLMVLLRSNLSMKWMNILSLLGAIAVHMHSEYGGGMLG